MILDRQNLFSDEQTLAQPAGATASTNSLDLTKANRRPGLGLSLYAQIVETIVGATATLVVALQDSANDSSYATVLTAPTLTVGTDTVTAGTEIKLEIPEHLQVRRYVRLLYTTAVATTTAGKITAGLVPRMDRQTANIGSALA